MTAENDGAQMDLIELHQRTIDRDLSALTQARRDDFAPSMFVSRSGRNTAETNLSMAMKSLGVVLNPHNILATNDGLYVAGPVGMQHSEMVSRLNRGRIGRKQGLLLGRYAVTFISGMGFSLQMDPETKYVRLDRELAGYSIPPCAETLGSDGYIVLDANYQRVERATEQRS